MGNTFTLTVAKGVFASAGSQLIAHLHMSHNVNNLVNHFVCKGKYRRFKFTDSIEESLLQICAIISERYEWIDFLKIGVDNNHVRFLIQSVLSRSPSEIDHPVKSITVRRIFAEHPEDKKHLWGGKSEPTGILWQQWARMQTRT